MSGDTYTPTDNDAAGDSHRRNEEFSAPVIKKQTFDASETTLLTDIQTYFADEKIQIPETDVSLF